MDDLRKIIAETVRDRLNTVTITDVDVQEGEDHDGDPVLFVRIVFDADVEQLDRNRTVGLIRHLRSRLAEIGETRFPHTRLLAQFDWDEAAA